MSGSCFHVNGRGTTRSGAFEADPHKESDPPWTPLLYVVLWLSVTVGFARGYDYRAALMAFQTSDILKPLTEKALKSHGDVDSSHSPWCAASEGIHLLHWFQAIVVVLGVVSPPAAGLLCRAWGRKAGLLLGAILGITGLVLCGTSFSAPQLLLGKYTSLVASPILYLAIVLADVEMAPQRARGRFHVAHQVGYAIGSLLAEALSALVVFTGARRPVRQLWRLVILLGVLPYATVLLLLPWLYESPASLLQRGKMNKGWAALKELRGPFHGGVWAEYQSLVSEVHGESGSRAKLAEVFERRNLPGLLLALCLSCLASRVDGATLIRVSQMELATAGVRHLGALVPGFTLAGSVLIGLCVAALLVDWKGRITCLGLSAVICLLSAGTLFGLVVAGRGPGAGETVPWAILGLLFWCWFQLGVWIGWVSVVWLVVAELQALRVRTTVLGLSFSLSFAVYSVQQQLMCKLEYKAFGVVAAAQLIALVLTLTCIPETNCAPVGGTTVLQRHWIWKHFYEPPKRGGRSGKGSTMGPYSESQGGAPQAWHTADQGGGVFPGKGEVGPGVQTSQPSPRARRSVQGQLPRQVFGWLGQTWGPAGFDQATDREPKQQQLVKLAGSASAAVPSSPFAGSGLLGPGAGSSSLDGSRGGIGLVDRGLPASTANTKRAIVSAALHGARSMMPSHRGRRDSWDGVDPGEDHFQGDEIMEHLRLELQEESPVWSPLASSGSSHQQGGQRRLNRLFTRRSRPPGAGLPSL